jgi:signal transduction histidine kinase
MMRARQMSLRWRLTVGLLIFQVLALLICSLLTFAIAFQSAPLGVIASLHLNNAVGESITRDASGALQIVPNPQLQDLLDSSPQIWAVAISESGERITLGDVPPAMLAVSGIADKLRTVTFEGQNENPEITARFDRITTDLGAFATLTGGGGFMSLFEAVLLFGHFATVVPGIALIILTLIGVPLVIKLCLRTLKDLTGQINRIDFAARGMRLTDSRVPREILPVVAGVNEALQRIDAGFEITERFFMNAAHELRTPIAILQVQLDGFPPDAAHQKFRAVVRRLTVVVNQILDIERFRQNPMERQLLDLRTTMSAVVADLAPYAIAEGYSIELEQPESPVWVHGDGQALDRLVINLVQNAIQHGGRWGTLTVSLDADGTIAVQDQGPGVPEDRREQIFEPFYRVNPQGAGSGLGLKIVRDIARSHRGGAILAESSPSGSRFVVTLPVVSHNDVHAGIRDGRFLTPPRLV